MPSYSNTAQPLQHVDELHVDVVAVLEVAAQPAAAEFERFR
jgi:hypothetical protein